MRAILVVVSAPILGLFLRVGKRQDPVGVRTFRPEAGVERFDERVVSRLGQSAWSVGLPGREKSRTTLFWQAHRSRSRDTNSDP